MSENSVFKPTPQHRWLQRLVGNWDVTCSYYSIPGDDPIVVPGKERVEKLGDFWIVGHFEADMLGTPIIGQSVAGYDPVRKLFVGSWKDNYTPFHYTFEGELNDDETELFLTGQNYDPMRQRTSTYQSCTEYIGEAERVLTLSVLVEDEDIPILEYRYVRK